MLVTFGFKMRDKPGLGSVTISPHLAPVQPGGHIQYGTGALTHVPLCKQKSVSAHGHGNSTF